MSNHFVSPQVGFHQTLANFNHTKLNDFCSFVITNLKWGGPIREGDLPLSSYWRRECHLYKQSKSCEGIVICRVKTVSSLPRYFNPAPGIKLTTSHSTIQYSTKSAYSAACAPFLLPPPHPLHKG